MRATVLICDLLYVWAVIMFTRTIQATRSTRTQVRISYFLLFGIRARTLRFKRKESHHAHPPDTPCTAAHRLWTFSIQLRHVRLAFEPSSREQAPTDHLSATALTLLSVNYMSKGRDLIAAVFFVASLGFKQMALYYAPAIGSYLLAKCIYLGHKNGCVILSSCPALHLTVTQHRAGVHCSCSSVL